MTLPFLLIIGFACLPKMGMALTSTMARPTSVRFAAPTGSHYGFLEIGLSDGSWGPVCDLGKFDLNAVRLACSLMNFNANLSVAKLSASETAAPLARPVIAIKNCDSFNVKFRSTWDLAVACEYIIGRDIPKQCHNSGNYVQISCHSSSVVQPTRSAVVPDAATTQPAVYSVQPVPLHTNGGRCAITGRYNVSEFVELKDRRVLFNNVTVCSDQFGIREAQSVCSVLCQGSFVGLPDRLPWRPGMVADSSDRTGVLLSCSGGSSKGLDSCSRSVAVCRSGQAALECLPQGGPSREPPRPSLDCSDRGFRVAFLLADGVESPNRLTLEPTVHPKNCTGFSLGSNATHVWLDLAYTECNVSQSYNASHQLYKMEIRLLPSVASTSALVYTDTPLRVPILCALPSRASLGAAAVDVAAIPMPESSGQAKFVTDIGLFASLLPSADGASLEFQQPLTNSAVEQTPVLLGQPIFARVRLLQVDDTLAVKLRLIDCWATSVPNASALPRYNLLVNRCPTANVRLIDISDRLVGLRFLAFRFAGDSAGRMHVHCNLSVCNRSDPIECRGCQRDSAESVILGQRRRRRRSAGMDDSVTNLVSTGAELYVSNTANLDNSGKYLSTFFPLLYMLLFVLLG